MKTLLCGAVLLSLLVRWSAQAAIYSANFDDGHFPSGSTKTGVTYVNLTGGVNNSGDMHITDAFNIETGDWIIFDFSAGAPVSFLNVNFKLELGGSTSGTPADGISFNWDTNLPTTLTETGGGNGLSVVFNTYNGGAPYAAVKWRGSVIAQNNSFNFSAANNAFVPVEIILANGSVFVFFNGAPLFTGVGIPGFAPIAGGQFSFAARTGGLNERHWLDEVSIDTGVPVFEPYLSFMPTATPGVNGTPVAVCAADFNGDGKIDLACPNYTSSTVTILTNNGSGGFNLSSLPSVPGLLTYMVTADVNGDNKPDLIVGNSTYGAVTVLTNNGSGGFVQASQPAVGNSPLDVQAVDINGDGRPDIITANTGGNSITILTNTSGGNFASTSVVPVAGNPNTVAVADFNGDGLPDVVCGYQTANFITVLTNKGGGIFVSNISYTVGGDTRAVATADINKDGKPDVICANFLDNTITILLNNGSGTLVSNATYSVGARPIRILPVDINGDGNVDLVVCSVSDSVLTVLINNGTGGFVNVMSLPTGGSPYDVAAADVDGDGRLDLISANQNDVNLTVLSSTPAYLIGRPIYFSLFAPATTTPALLKSGILPGGLTFSDQGNGSATLLGTPTNTGAFPLTFTATNGQGVTTQSVTLNVYQPPSFPGQTFSYLPFISPGVSSPGMDYLVATNLTPGAPVSLITDNQPGSSLVQVLTNYGTGGFRPGASYNVNARLVAGVAADFNNDGKPDLAGVDFDHDRVVVLTNGSGGTLSISTSNTVNHSPVAMAVGDLNGDNKPDLVTGNRFANTLSVLINDGTGHFNLTTNIHVAGFPACVLATDLDNDGKTDLIYGNNDTNTITIFTNKGGGIFVSNATYQVGMSPNSLVAADLDGNGLTDIICASANGTLTVWNNPGGPVITPNTYSLNVGLNQVLAVDVNGDGKLDVVCDNSSYNTVTILTNNGSGGLVVMGTYFTGNIPGPLALGDANRDGLTDIICGDSDGTLTILLATNSYQGDFTVGVTGQVTFSATGYPTPTFIPSGSLPAGVTFTNNGNGTCSIIGTPSVTGTYHFTITASNPSGTASLNYTLVSLATPPAPKLTLDTSIFGFPIVTWPSDYFMYRLQTSTNLINWEDYTDTINQFFGVNSVVNGDAGPYQFFRLKN